MAWLKKRPDPIKDRARLLESEIAALEAEIKRLDSQLQQKGNGSELFAEPERATGNKKPNGNSSAEPIFEEVNHGRLDTGEASHPEHYNELGFRKYDLPALLSRMKNHLRGPSTTNPKLVSYLAAGGIHGLRPLRYEKRVARNRFILFVMSLFLALLGIIVVFLRQN